MTIGSTKNMTELASLFSARSKKDEAALMSVMSAQEEVGLEIDAEIAKEASLKYYRLGHGEEKQEDESFKALGALEHALKEIIKKDYSSRGGNSTSGLRYDLQILKILVNAALETSSRQFAKEAV